MCSGFGISRILWERAASGRPRATMAGSVSTAASTAVAAPQQGDGPDPQGAPGRPSADLRPDLGGDPGRAAGPAPGPKTFYGGRGPVRDLVGRGRPRRGRRSRCPTPGTPSRPSNAILADAGQGLLPPEGLSDRAGRPAGDRPAPSGPVPGVEGPGPARLPRFAAAGIPEDAEEGDLRRRVRAAGRGRDHAHPRRADEADGRGSGCRRGQREENGPGAARPDGRRDRPRRGQGFRQSRPRFDETRSWRSSPRRSRCRRRRACWSSFLRAFRSTTSAATTS